MRRVSRWPPGSNHAAPIAGFIKTLRTAVSAAPGQAVRVRGVVQGVGFRPAVWRLARRCRLRGAVWNDAEGVMIHAWGETFDLDEFLRLLPLQAPPLARIDSIESAVLSAACTAHSFEILASRSESAAQTAIAADAAVCPACLAEVSDPSERRYRYPFANCTHCGPRLSIVEAIPYDRANTSMRHFPLCPRCAEEYGNPADRRFHAQAIACPDCGPALWLENAHGEKLESGTADAISAAAELLMQGYILAIKGIGGFHLACLAENAAAVERLRAAKQRNSKPFALMAKDIDAVRRHAEIDALELAALQDKAAPIVILRAHGGTLPDAVAPGDHTLGFMLPYTPLHHLLMQALPGPIVLTSGNRGEEPQCVSNDEARRELYGIADYALLHDRGIVNRLDDSVLRVADGKPRLLRRARGYCPEPLLLPEGFENAPAILAMGGELKNTFCLLKDGQAIVSQHLGDLENPRAQRDYRRSLELYRQLFEFQPETVAADLHPGYLSGQCGAELAERENLPLQSIQHHHAHIAACLAEHGRPLDAPPVLGIAFDGLGLGNDGALWGGEFLLADYRGFTRLAHLQPIALPGGGQAMREPWRNAYANLAHYFDRAELRRRFSNLDIVRFLDAKPLTILDAMLEKRLNSPLSSSCGRLLDAFAAALGLCREGIGYEGEAAIKLESLAAAVFHRPNQAGYPFEWRPGATGMTLHCGCCWEALLTDLQRGAAAELVAARIHRGLASAAADMALQLCRRSGTDTVALSGGVFQNRLLSSEIGAQLRAQGLQVLAPSLFPANDGGLSLGQAVAAAAAALAAKPSVRRENVKL